MNNVLQYLVYLIVGIFSISGMMLLVLLLEFITRMIPQILNLIFTFMLDADIDLS